MKTKRAGEDQLKEVEQNNVVSMLNGRALGIGKNNTGQYVVVMLEFDSVTGESKVIRSIEVGSSKLEAAERFKVLAVEEGLVV